MSAQEKKPTCSCCQGNAWTNLLTGNRTMKAPAAPGSMTRSDFLKIIGLGLGSLGLSSLAGTQAFAAAQANKDVRIVKGQQDHMVINFKNKELLISSTVTKDASKPSVVDWGRRFQAFFGCKGGKMEPFFVFTTDVPRPEIDKALQAIGLRSRRQIPMEEVEKRTGLKPTTQREDYLEGDPVIVTIRWLKDGNIVEAAMEDLIDEKIIVEGKEVFKPYTPHFVYHGTAEVINFLSGCVVCPSDCNGGIITDNVLPLKTTVNYYKVNWDRMPPVGSKAEVVLKSIYGDYQTPGA